jgi:hypothetical protein
MFGLTALKLARIQFGFTVSFSYCLSSDHDRAGELPRRSRRFVAMEERHRLPRPLPFLVEDLRRELRHGRRLRPRHGLSVRHQLEAISRHSRVALPVRRLTYEVLTAFFSKLAFSALRCSDGTR